MKELIGKRPELKMLSVSNVVAVLFVAAGLPVVTQPVSGIEIVPAPQRIQVPNGDGRDHGFYLPFSNENVMHSNYSQLSLAQRIK